MRAEANQIHIMRSSRYGEIMMSKEVLAGKTLRPDLTASCAADSYSYKCGIDTLPLKDWFVDGDGSLTIYRREYEAACDEERVKMTHVLLIGMKDGIAQPDQTIHANFGCDKTVEYHLAMTIARTDSSTLISARSRESDEHHPYWFEVLNRTE